MSVSRPIGEQTRMQRSLSLSKALTRIISLCMLPLFSVAAILAFLQIRTIHEEQFEDALRLAKNVILYTDNAISSRINGLNMLATSPFVDDPAKWDLLYREAQAFSRSFGTQVVITDGAKQPQLLLNTRVPFGTKLPAVKGAKGRLAGPLALRTGKPAVSDLFDGPVAKASLIGIAVPVIRQGTPEFAVLTVLATKFFQDQIDAVSLPSDWYLALKDARGQTIAHLNQAPAGGWTSHIIARSTVSKWSVEIDIPPIAHWTPIVPAAIALSAILLTATLTGFLGGKWAGRRIGKAISSLTAADLSETAINDKITEIAAARKLIKNQSERRMEVENALRVKMLEYEAIFERSIVGKAQADPQTGRFLKVNQALADLTGYSPEELSRMTFTDITHPDDRQRDARSLQPDSNGKFDNWQIEKRYLKKDGSVIWVLVASNRITFDDGRPDRTIAVIQDITEKKKFEENLRRHEKRLQLALTASHAFAWSWDLKKNTLNFSAYAKKLLKHPDGMSARSGWRIVHPEDVNSLRLTVEKAIAEKSQYQADYRVIVPDTKDIVWLHSRAQVECDAAGQPVYLYGIDTNITELKQAEAELMNSYKRSDLLARVAQRLLSAENPQAIVEDLCRIVMEHIDCQCFFNYLVDMPGRRMALNAYAGIAAESAETIRKLDFGVAVCGCVARDGARMIAEHIDASEDINTQLVKSFGVKAYCCHPLSIEGKLLGTLSFGTRTRPAFTSDQVSLMKAVADHVALAMHRLQATKALRESEGRLRASLAEKEVLLKEIHHRVKNNMQVISSLVDLQAAEVKDEAMQAVFKDIIFRVRSMAMVHEKLYQSEDLAHVEFADYTRSLLGYLWRTQGAAAPGVNLEMNLHPVYLPVDEAVPCGLMLNELFTNALKHAFVDRESGNVLVSLRSNAKKKVILSVGDDGIGLPPEIDIKKARSLGLRLVEMLARQLHASVEMHNDNGTEFTVTFEVPEPCANPTVA